MPYIPHTEEDRKKMLATIGVDSIDDLFCEIPENLRFRGEFDMPNGLDEHHLFLHLFEIAAKNQSSAKLTWFLGAGLYDRYIPASVGAVISRGEFLTAYTPYQPEFSQGYLQTIYEFQSMVAELYGMDVANASMYDGSTSMAEAALMSCAATGRSKIVVSESVHPHYRQVLETYAWSSSHRCEEITTPEGLTTDFSKVDGETACVIVQYPNFFGQIEDLKAARAAASEHGALLVVVADPVAMALLPPPGEFGADVVVGEGQPLGIPMGFGGPMVGLYACKKEYVRRLPGRIVGRTQDDQGRSGFTMTLRTREQDIRREKATSNICTNEALMALAATVYLCAVGKNGLQSVAESTVRNTQYAIQRLTDAGGKVRFAGRVFGEFVLELPRNAGDVRDALIGKGIMAGLPLGPYYPKLETCLLVALTEVRTKEQIDDFANKLAAAIR